MRKIRRYGFLGANLVLAMGLLLSCSDLTAIILLIFKDGCSIGFSKQAVNSAIVIFHSLCRARWWLIIWCRCRRILRDRYQVAFATCQELLMWENIGWPGIHDTSYTSCIGSLLHLIIATITIYDHFSIIIDSCRFSKCKYLIFLLLKLLLTFSRHRLYRQISIFNYFLTLVTSGLRG